MKLGGGIILGSNWIRSFARGSSDKIFSDVYLLKITPMPNNTSWEHLTDIAIAVYQPGKKSLWNWSNQHAKKLMLYSDLVELTNDEIKAVIKMLKVITRGDYD